MSHRFSNAHDLILKSDFTYTECLLYARYYSQVFTNRILINIFQEIFHVFIGWNGNTFCYANQIYLKLKPFIMICYLFFLCQCDTFRRWMIVFRGSDGQPQGLGNKENVTALWIVKTAINTQNVRMRNRVHSMPADQNQGSETTEEGVGNCGALLPCKCEHWVAAQLLAFAASRECTQNLDRLLGFVKEAVKSDFWILTSNLIFFQLCEPNNI